MPELPEVETIARNLREGKDGLPLLGQQMIGCDVLWERSVAEPEVASFRRWITGQHIRAIGRRAKYFVATLDNATLLIHLRMSGDLRVETEHLPDGQARPLAAHDRIIFHLAGDWRWAFNDARKFGRVWLVSDPQTVLGHLGPEPLDGSLSAADFYASLHARSRQMKPLLLDQSFIAGLGNIYTDESLFLAGIHPNRASDSLSAEEAGRLLAAIREVLQDGIHRNGASIDWVYRGGHYQNMFRVYQRTGEPCGRCGTPIERSVVGQRGTHFCPVCQPAK